MVQFTVSGKIFQEASSRIAKIVKSDNLNIVVNKGHILLHAEADMHEATHIIPALVVRPGKVTVTKATIDAILRSRGDIEIKIKDSMLSFKDPNSGYKGSNIPTLPFSEAEVFEPKFKASTWDKELQACILQGLSACMLQSFYESDQLPIFLEKRGDKLIIASADAFHVAICQIAVDKTFELKPISIPSSYAPIISGFGVEPFKLMVGASSIRITTETFSCSLPSLQVAQSVTMEQVLSLLTNEQKPSFRGNVKTEAMSTSLTGLQVVYEVGTGTNLSVEKSKLTMALNTSYGKTEDTINIEVLSTTPGAAISINSENLDDILGRTSGVVQMSWYKDSGARFHKELNKKMTVDYLVSAYTDSESEKIKSKAKANAENEDE